MIAIAASPLLTQCKDLSKAGVPGVPGGGGSCPSSEADIEKATWGLNADVEGKLKAGLSAAASIKEISAKIEGDVTTACTNLAKDLGATDADIAPKGDGPGKKAEAACDAAAKFLGDLKAKAHAKIEVKAKEPVCHASIDAMADCAAHCDANVKPGSVDVKCEGGKLSGTCDAECKGTCTVEAGAKCEGTCSGECKGDCEAATASATASATARPRRARSAPGRATASARAERTVRAPAPARASATLLARWMRRASAPARARAPAACR
jgi:hypothetical protein